MSGSNPRMQTSLEPKNLEHQENRQHKSVRKNSDDKNLTLKELAAKMNCSKNLWLNIRHKKKCKLKGPTANGLILRVYRKPGH